MKSSIIDVVIPVYKPGEEFKELIRRLELQKLEIRNIILMHTKDGNDLMNSEFIKGNDNIIIKEIETEEFDHGGTRDKGIRCSDADYVLFMTQDALPADRRLTENLWNGMKDESVAVAYARQIPRKDCSVSERFIRNYNYPKSSIVKSKANLDSMGIKTYFCSNVCALYRKDLYLRQGGFERRVIFNEDMLYAAKCIQDGYKIAYVAEAKVIHSHNYTNRQQFQRNFDLAVSQAQHPETFEGIKSESEGIRMVKNTIIHLLKTRHPMMVLGVIMSSAAKYMGYLTGKHYKILPQVIVNKCTMSPRYWRKNYN